MKTIALQQQIIYGPVRSRRLGNSLGINLLPVGFKLCTLNCIYCQYGWTKNQELKGRFYQNELPSVNDVVFELINALTSNTSIDYITFSGNGEPTLHPDFHEIVDEVVQIRDEIRPDVKVALLSNSTTCTSLLVRQAIEKIDFRIMKLDAGNDRMFLKMNHGVPPITFCTVLYGLSLLKRFTIQTMFVSGKIDNSSDAEVQSWVERLQELQPGQVQIYSLDRDPASASLQRVHQDRLREIARLAEEETGVRVDVF